MDPKKELWSLWVGFKQEGFALNTAYGKNGHLDARKRRPKKQGADQIL